MKTKFLIVTTFVLAFFSAVQQNEIVNQNNDSNFITMKKVSMEEFDMLSKQMRKTKINQKTSRNNCFEQQKYNIVWKGNAATDTGIGEQIRRDRRAYYQSIGLDKIIYTRDRLREIWVFHVGQQITGPCYPGEVITGQIRNDGDVEVDQDQDSDDG